MPRKATAKTSFGVKKANANQIREWTNLDYQHECEAAAQLICDASVDEDFQYHELTSQHFGFHEDAQTRLQSPQLHYPYNSRHLSSYENLVIGGAHQPTRFVMEETQMQQPNELLNTRVQEVPLIEVLQEMPGICKEEKSETINWLGRVPKLEPGMQTCMNNVIADIMERKPESVMQEQQVPQEDTAFARPPSRQQIVPERLENKAAEQLSSSARLVNPADINLKAITAGSSDLLNSSKTNSDQTQSDKLYQPDLRADELKKEKEVGDYIDRIIAAETIRLRNESTEKKDRGKSKGRRNKSVSKLSIAHQYEFNQEDYGHIQESNSIIQQQHPALCRALGKPRKLRQLSDRANVPYLVIAGLALHNAKTPLTSKEVYRFARYYFPRCVISSSWKNSLRCSLSTNNVFKQDGITEGNAYLWSIANRSELWDAIKTFVAGNRDQNTYGMTDPSLWAKLLEGSMGVLDKSIEVDLGNSDGSPKAPKKRANQREGNMTPHKQRCYGSQQPNPPKFNSIPQNYQHIPHFAHPYFQMASNGCDEYGYQQMIAACAKRPTQLTTPISKETSKVSSTSSRKKRQGDLIKECKPSSKRYAPYYLRPIGTADVPRIPPRSPDAPKPYEPTSPRILTPMEVPRFILVFTGDRRRTVPPHLVGITDLEPRFKYVENDDERCKLIKLIIFQCFFELRGREE